MQMKPKLLLVISILCLVAGAIIALAVNTQKIPSLNVVFPLGVILAGTYLVLLLFEKESRIAADDQQQVLAQAGIEAPRDKVPAKHGSTPSK
jgi:predicted membrane-bound mannosyltransferase